MSRLDKAIQLATEVHAGQVDKGGNPYILHPLRVMCAVEKDLRSGSWEYREDYLCVAICHDVVEDKNMFYEDYIHESILELGDTVYMAILAVSRRGEESWKSYINRISINSIAKFVKIHDLEDNCDLTRLKEITDDDVNRNNMYIRARKFLETEEGKL